MLMGAPRTGERERGSGVRLARRPETRHARLERQDGSGGQGGEVAGAVGVAGHHRLAVGREGDAEAAERLELLRHDRLAVGDVPDGQVSAVAAGRHALAVGRQGQAVGLIRSRAEWANLAIIGRCERQREVDGKVTTEVSYFIGSRATLGAQGYAKALGRHWGIDNNCHWQLDVTFGEDACRVADRNAAENLSAVRRHALALLKRHPRKASIANKQFAASLSTSFLS